jgi:senataxin
MLLQGPPGTGISLVSGYSSTNDFNCFCPGKTKTVMHLINVLHLTSYQTHYQSVVDASLSTLKSRNPSPSPRSSSVKTEANKTQDAQSFTLTELVDMIEHANKTGTRRAQIFPRPRILVCAPSNAGVDEIMARVAQEGLVDGNARPYVPDMVRIGSTNRVRRELYDVSLCS